MADEHQHKILCAGCGQNFTGATMKEVKAKAQKHKAEKHSK